MRSPGSGRLVKGVLAGLLSLAGAAAFACTGMYAGKGVSEDGSVLLGRTVDTCPWTSAHRHVVTPRVENVPGRVYRSWKTGFRWKLPPTTWHCVSTPRVRTLGRGTMDSACVNERGFAVSGTVTANPHEKVVAADPFNRESGPGEDSLPGLMALCCSSAREALDLLAEVIAACGHENGEIYMLADKDEAWYVEVYSGHQWAAVRMPEDKVACWGNQFMIRSFDPAAKDVRCSPGLVSVPEKAGFLVRDENGKADLFRTYSRPLADYSNYRTWFGHRTLAPETAGTYAPDRPMELFYAPARKVGYRDLFELMRTRYEGTDRNPEANHTQKVRVIGTTKQATSHVISIDPRLPAACRGTIWASLGNCEHTVFMPLNAAIAESDAAFAADQTTGWYRSDDKLASTAFRRLAALAEKDRYWYGKGVRDYWRAREDFYLERFPKLLAEAAAKGVADPKGAARMLTDFTLAAERKDLQDAKLILDELLWYITENNRIEGDGSGATFQPAAPFVARAAQRQKTKVLFFFDTEDFTCDESNDAIRDIANILKDEGVRGNFAMIGYLGRFLQEKGRQDVIDALRHHLVGSQTLYHSRHPNIVEYGDVADYAAAYRRTMEEEKLGFEMLESALGMPCRWCSVFPGNGNSYVGLYVHAQLGSRIFGGGNGSFTPGERQAAWYANQFHLPYYKRLHLESFIPPGKPLDLAKTLNALSTNDIVTLYMHPHMALSKQHWDGPNFDPRHPVEWGKWLPTPKRDKRDVAVYYDRLRALVHALATDSRFEVTDCEKLQASFRPRKPITKREIPEIRRALLKRLAPVGYPHTPWCVADAFQAAVRLLRGETSHLPGFVYGFLDSPRGVTRPVEVAAAELRVAAEKIDLDTFVPSEIAVGGQAIGPADFLLAALEVLETGAEKVSVVPRDQLGPIGELMPSLATYSMKGGWPLYEDTFEDKYMTARLRLQLWTLRYEN